MMSRSNMATGQVTGLFTEEMTTGNSFGLQDSVCVSTKWVYEEGLYPHCICQSFHSISVKPLLSVIPIFSGAGWLTHKNEI